jgi:hypothetical protein
MKHRSKLRTIVILVIVILLAVRLATHALAVPSISGDGWGYIDRAFYIHDHGKLPPLAIHPVGYSIALSKLAFLGKEILPIVTIRIQQILDLAVISILVAFSWLLSLKISNKFYRNLFLSLSCFFLLIQPFTAKLSNSLYTESSVMALCFVGLGIFTFYISRVFHHWAVGLLVAVPGGIVMGMASTMRIDIFALNTTFLLSIFICFLVLRQPSKSRKTFHFLLLSLILPAALLINQFHSTGELGFQTYQKKIYPIEFISWTGTWRADRQEHGRFAWLSSRVDNLNTDLFPAKAFGSSEEKRKVESLFRTWKQEGYTDVVRSGFQEVVKNKRASQPFDFYILNPLYRMYHHWINLEGAEFYFSSFAIPSGIASRLLVIFVFALRVVLLSLFAYGFYIFTIKVVHPFQNSDQTPNLTRFNSLNGCEYMVAFSILYVLMRTLEMGALSTMNAGGLMEPRYVIVAFPPLLLVSIYGACQLIRTTIDKETCQTEHLR